MPRNPLADRRTLLRAAAALPAAAVAVGALEGEAAASGAPDLPDFAPVLAAATGP